MGDIMQNLVRKRKAMDIKIGITTHTLVAKKLKADQHTKDQASKPKNAHVQEEAMLDDDDEMDY